MMTRDRGMCGLTVCDCPCADCTGYVGPAFLCVGIGADCPNPTEALDDEGEDGPWCARCRGEAIYVRRGQVKRFHHLGRAAGGG